ncbi:uncharacterized UDP-glucosyltransferase YjiC-like [Tetranychus urticae]|uniref:UDP-glycosyltransferase 203E1 n=1 Tax=Tetranychus urticae TaxID=32264 RepID=T1KNV1_TETUR|nr:uncharacterized UDP-glucosyltransferase YjiC-like [Tetranychus urticae]AHX56899.1 UDP-glycosyltransferase 203E1 [Tetranychus urticae]
MKLKTLFIPMDAYGHVNSCIGLAKQLIKYDHEIIFIVPTNWTKAVEGHGFTIKTVSLEGYEANVDPQSGFSHFMEDKEKLYNMEPIEQFEVLNVNIHDAFLRYLEQTDDQYEQLISQIKPYLIIYDFWVTVPAILKSGIPYILLWSCSPTLPYWKVNGPPYSSGLGISDAPEKLKKYRDDMNSLLKDKKSKFYDYYQSRGIDISKVTFLDFTMLNESPYLSVYSYPEDLDYSEYGPVPDKWFRLDHIVRLSDPATPLGIDATFFQTKDKVILFTLGSLGTSNYNLITRLVNFLEKSKHKYIVSTGVHHDKIKLHANMCGSQYLNQMAIMPRVDMVIHHGGNNSLVETLYFGKPFIVMPLFGDQHDNARRVVDKKIGKWLHPFRVSEDELLKTIDEVLSDEEMHERVKLISLKMQNTKSHQIFNEKIIKIVKEHTKQ